jgi:hypothetical protein
MLGDGSAPAVRRPSLDCFVFLRKQEHRAIWYFATLGSCLRRSTAHPDNDDDRITRMLGTIVFGLERFAKSRQR